MDHALLVVDPQNDFCDLPAGRCPPGESPALPVAGADADMRRLAAFIDAAGDRIDAITVTLDSHQWLDIAHPGFWQRADGSAVPPFTAIDAAALRAGVFVPRDAAARARAQAYVDELERRGRYRLMVWPVHCELGSWGHAVHADVRAAYNRWEARRRRSVRRLVKGLNPWTEHYSALAAEVPDAADPATQLRRDWIDPAAAGACVLVAGEASSHCVRATVLDLVEHGLVEPSRLVLLADAMSPVAGFEREAAAFLDAIAARGATVTDTARALARLAAG